MLSFNTETALEIWVSPIFSSSVLWMRKQIQRRSLTTQGHTGSSFPVRIFCDKHYISILTERLLAILNIHVVCKLIAQAILFYWNVFNS